MTVQVFEFYSQMSHNNYAYTYCNVYVTRVYVRVILFPLPHVSSLPYLQHEVESSIDLLSSKNAELESMLDYLRAQPDKIDVDDAVSATSPLYNQYS